MHDWIRKFACAFRGLRLGVQGESSYSIHLPVAAIVLILAAFLDATLWHWSLIVLSITMVISLEMFNTSIERLVRTLHPDQHPVIGETLDIASAAVLVGSIGAAVVGLIVFGDLILQRF